MIKHAVSVIVKRKKERVRQYNTHAGTFLTEYQR